MAKERLDTLREIVFDHPDRFVGCAQIQKPNGGKYYAGFADGSPVEEEVIALIEDEFRTGTTDFHIVKVPIELTVIPRLRNLLG